MSASRQLSVAEVADFYAKGGRQPLRRKRPTTCVDCGDKLVTNQNWSDSIRRYGIYCCRTCHAARTRARRAKLRSLRLAPPAGSLSTPSPPPSVQKGHRRDHFRILFSRASNGLCYVGLIAAILYGYVLGCHVR